MSTERLRIDNWQTNFFEFVRKDSPQLLHLFENRLLILPRDDGSIEPALDELDERYASREQIDKMWELFESFGKENKL